MADVQINQLPGAVALAGAEVLPLDQGTATVRASVLDIANYAAVPRLVNVMPIAGALPTVAECDSALASLGKDKLSSRAFVIYDNGGAADKYFLVHWVEPVAKYFAATFDEVT